ncbi:MAG: FecR family protein [Porticoccaceae bacterium]|nr:FecR family protein [Porticoccaceae bacterium]
MASTKMLINVFLALVMSWPMALLAASKPASVGRVIFIDGDVSARRDGADTRTLAQGDKIYTSDQLITSANGYVHVRFVDGGLVSVRPDSQVLINTYELEPGNADSPDKGRVRITLEKGVMRSATGTIGQHNKEHFRINTPVSAIGIRGTDFVVFADQSIARLLVKSGGVVMAPFGDNCSASSFAPCSGDVSAELFASVGKAMLEVRAGQGFALVTSDGPTPDEVSPPHPEEADLFAAFIASAQQALRGKIGLSAPGADSYEDGLENTQRYLSEESLVQQAYLLGEKESSNPLPNNRGLDDDPQVIWGRWSTFAGDDPSYRTISQLLYETRQYAVLNNVFAMLEDKHDRGNILLPDAGQVSFKLNGYEAYIQRGATLEAAGISNPALIVDFKSSRFATRLDIHAQSLPGVVPVLGAGDLTADGFFHSDGNSLAKIDGVLSPDIQEAGFLFDYQVSPGVNAVGATQWINNGSLSP